MKKRMEELYELLAKYSYEYHVNNNSEINDYDYDKLYQELLTLEEKYPQYKRLDGVTSQVGDIIDNRFKKLTHQNKMLSLDNAFKIDELHKFDLDIKKVTTDFTYVCELKIDGLAMSFIYEDKHLNRGVTRGNGTVGEDVTHNVLTIKSLPHYIDVDNLEVRGEVFVSKDNFKLINEAQEQANDKVYANARNLASGSIRQLDSSVTKSRNLDAFIYSMEDPIHKTHFESLMYVKELGFNVNEHLSVAKDITEVISYIEKFVAMRNDLDYYIDGIVIKVNEYAVRKQLGFTNRAPKWAIAYKFQAEEATTIINDIVFNVGRTGKITPVAVLDSVKVDGSVVSKATLHNEDYIKSKDVRISDTVIIHKAGDIIPEVVSVVKEHRSNSKPTKMIDKCPVCNSVLEKVSANYYCVNDFCDAKIVRNLIYFVSIDAMDIKALGEQIIELLYNKGYLKSIIDIYELHKYRKELLAIPSFGQKRVDLLLANIDKSKHNRLEQFITGLGIRNVGKQVASSLVNHFNDFDKIVNASYEDFIEIDDIGDTIANNLVAYFQTAYFLEIYDYVKRHDFSFEIKAISHDSKYFAKTVCITGTFSKYSRSEISEVFKQLGAKVVNSVSKNTDYLVVGTNPGSKYDKAVTLNIKIIDEQKLMMIMEEFNG